jgi:hypothetical protein
MVKRDELEQLRAAGAEILADLQQPDALTRRFNPLGFGGMISAEDAARFQSATVARAVLADDVPEDVRDNFSRVRKLHLYGVLEYDFFTVAAEYALLVLEGALRLRFITYYANQIPVSARGVEGVLDAPTFDAVRNARYKGSRLRAADGRTRDLPISGNELFDWARRERLLPGTRTRGVDKALSHLRNYAAHPVTHTVLMPPDSAGTIRDVSEIINKLWGHDSPEGRFFTGPVTRRLHIVGLSPDRTQATGFRLEALHGYEGEGADWTYAVFLASDEERLTDIPIGFTHRRGFQATWFPCERLWEGSWAELVKAVEAGDFVDREDEVEYLDRLFYVRRGEEELDLARSPADVAALKDAPAGEWFAIVADHPQDAWAHVRDHADVEPEDGACPHCFVRIEGRFSSASEALLAIDRSS